MSSFIYPPNSPSKGHEIQTACEKTAADRIHFYQHLPQKAATALIIFSPTTRSMYFTT
jgi:hypothetical protein